MTRKTSLFVAVSVAAALLAGTSMEACKSSSTSYGSTTTADAGGPSPGSDAGGGTAAPSCSEYCTAIMKNCTGGDGSTGSGGPDAAKTHQQYVSIDNCTAACTAFPVGKRTDTGGNTLGCRLYHANAAASNAALHCPHAGPGGDGVCGTACDGYCQLVNKFCVGAAKIYADDAACHTRCAATADDVRFNIGTQDGNHVACLLYHAQEAPLAPTDHCNGDLAEADGGSTGSVTCK